MYTGVVEAAVDRPETDILWEPKVSVAFDLEMGATAREHGVVMDVDQDRLHHALTQGGLTDEECMQYPVIIGRTDTGDMGSFTPLSNKNKTAAGSPQPALELYAFEGVGGVWTSTVVHEGRHLKDHLEWGREAFTSRQAERLRKVGFVAVGLAATTLYFYHAIKVGMLPSHGGTFAGAAVAEDFFTCAALSTEYATRKHERRAFWAMRNVRPQNVLKLEGAAHTDVTRPRASKLRMLGQGIKMGFVPKFDL